MRAAAEDVWLAQAIEVLTACKLRPPNASAEREGFRWSVLEGALPQVSGCVGSEAGSNRGSKRSAQTPTTGGTRL